MVDAREVAKYLIHLAQSGEEPDYLTHLRLQKLLYYVQGWFLGFTGNAMFSNRIEAWAHGPVVPDVYREYAKFDNSSISLDADAEFNLGDEELGFIGEIWETYKCFSASKLREMTHEEPPWINARKGLGPADRGNEEITNASLANHFGPLAKQ